MLIAICGIDGSGKTTQINMLSKYLEEEINKEVYVTKQPTDFYRKYDRFKKYVNRENCFEEENIVYELALLSAADKMRHYSTEIYPNINKFVISDRYVFSAYSYFLARGVKSIKWLKEINKKLPLPDVTIYIDIPVKTANQRVIQRDGKHAKKEEKDIVLLEKVRKHFLAQPWGTSEKYHIIDAEVLEPEDVHKKIVSIIKKYL